jgi:hypothetical protein
MNSDTYLIRKDAMSEELEGPKPDIRTPKSQYVYFPEVFFELLKRIQVKKGLNRFAQTKSLKPTFQHSSS